MDPGTIGWQPPDDLPFYYNQGNEIESRYLPSYSDDNAYGITFYDDPSVEASSSGQMIQFVTKLVGVDADGNEQPLSGSQINFTWASNARSISNFAYLFVDESELVPRDVSGGITGFQ
jgi:hypothetical protein